VLLSEAGYSQKKHDKMVGRIAKMSDVSITGAIEALAEGYERLYGVVAEEINDGMCEDFASDLKALVPGVSVKWIDEIDPMLRVAHAVAILDGRYYDSESPHGVDSLTELAVFQRCGLSENLVLDNIQKLR